MHSPYKVLVISSLLQTRILNSSDQTNKVANVYGLMFLSITMIFPAVIFLVYHCKMERSFPDYTLVR